MASLLLDAVSNKKSKLGGFNNQKTALTTLQVILSNKSLDINIIRI